MSDPGRFRRIHLLVGDSNMNEFSNALKMGTTVLMMDLIELGVCNPDWILFDAVNSMREISHDPTFKWEINLANDKTTTALNLQMEIAQTAKKHLSGTSLENDWIIEHWISVLEDLTKGPEAVMNRVDWASKYWMLNEFRREENLSWDDPWIKSLDLEFHNLNKNHGLFWGLEENGDVFRKTSIEAIERSKTSPPRGTRAHGRGELVKLLMGHEAGYLIDWIGFRLNKEEPFLMLDPFVSYKKEIQSYLEGLNLRRGQHPQEIT